METFAPSVVIDGESYTIPGWMWVLSAAVAGFEWAIFEADRPEFRAKVKDYMAAQECFKIKREIQRLEQQIADLKAKLPREVI